MFGFFKRKKGPVVYERPEHCISRKNIDSYALKVLYRLSECGYTAYLVGGGVRDLLLGRQPKDFDVATNAKPNEVKKIFRNCFLVGKRFRLAHVCFGRNIVETTTFRGPSASIGEIIEMAEQGPVEDNTFGTPETDAGRRDFTVNGLFYDIKTFAVIDYVGGMKDLEKRVIRAIGDPMVRFKVDPVRMMRAVKFASRLDFELDKKVRSAILKLHPLIKNAAEARVCEEVFRLFPFHSSEKAFRLLWELSLMEDLLPELSKFITQSGGAESPVWNYLKVLDRYDKAMSEKGVEISNALRLAVLYTAFVKGKRASEVKEGRKPQPNLARQLLSETLSLLKVPKSVYFSAVLMIDSERRLSTPPVRSRMRLLQNRDFLDALDYNRIVMRAESRNEDVLDKWADAYWESVEKHENACGVKDADGEAPHKDAAESAE
jgi:poly(A) polymerase